MESLSPMSLAIAASMGLPAEDSRMFNSVEEGADRHHIETSNDIIAEVNNVIHTNGTVESHVTLMDEDNFAFRNAQPESNLSTDGDMNHSDTAAHGAWGPLFDFKEKPQLLFSAQPLPVSENEAGKRRPLRNNFFKGKKISIPFTWIGTLVVHDRLFCLFNPFIGVKWSPDGSCMLTCNDDTSLRLWELPNVWDYTSEEVYV